MKGTQKKTLVNLMTLGAVVLLGGIAVVKLGGETVSMKFDEANSAVASQVTFGGGGYSPPPARVVTPPPSVPSPAAGRPTHHATTHDAMSTFAIDVDTGSYTLSRGYLERGYAPAPSEVRPEEFVNYFHYDYAAPPPGKTASVHFEAAPSPFSANGRTHLVRIGLQARGLAERPPTHLTFLVDTSGSMEGSGRLDLAREAIKVATRQLRPTDTVAIVTYAGASRVALESTAAHRLDEIDAAADRLTAGGGTAMSSGMDLAYRTAVEHAGDGVSRVFVLSDGDANIGATHPDAILDRLRAWSDDGVTLSTVGFGNGNYRDQMMERLADAGNGNYSYVDGEPELDRVFGDALNSLLYVVAKDVKVQVQWDADAVETWRQIGYENRQMSDRDFRNDAKDAGEMGAGHQVTALYEVRLAPGVEADDRLATVRFRHKKPDGFRASEASFELTGRHLRRRVGDASSDFRFQAAVAAFAERLRGQGGASWGWIEEVASAAAVGRPDRTRFLQLVRTARRIENRL